MADDVYVYAVLNEAGRLRAFVRDDPRYAADTAKIVSEWIMENRPVQRMTWAQAHANGIG